MNLRKFISTEGDALGPAGVGPIGPGRKLKHAGTLELVQRRELDHAAVGKLDCIVMGVRIVEINLAEPRKLGRHHVLAQARPHVVDHMAPEAIVANGLGEGEFGAWKQAHGNARLILGAEAARRCQRKAAGDEFVANCCGPADLVFQTVVAHRYTSASNEPSASEPLVRRPRTQRSGDGSGLGVEMRQPRRRLFPLGRTSVISPARKPVTSLLLSMAIERPQQGKVNILSLPARFASMGSMSMEPFFLGIDGGGSCCRARIRSADGNLLAEAIGGASNIHQDFEGALATIMATSREAAAKAGLQTDDIHAGFGIAGIVTSGGAEKIAEAALPFASLTVDNDAYAACIGAFDGGDGGIVIAGTGSIGFAIVEGQRHMVGGWGFKLGDHGSGAWVGYHAVRRAALAVDGLLQPTRLLTEIQARTGANRIDLSRWSEQARPRDYAQLAPLVFECAARGDVQGMMIVIEGAGAISSLGRALLDRGAKAICLLGGLSDVYPPYLDADVKQSLAEPRADAVDGTIMMARRSLGLAESWA